MQWQQYTTTTIYNDNNKYLTSCCHCFVFFLQCWVVTPSVQLRQPMVGTMKSRAMLHSGLQYVPIVRHWSTTRVRWSYVCCPCWSVFATLPEKIRKKFGEKTKKMENEWDLNESKTIESIRERERNRTKRRHIEEYTCSWSNASSHVVSVSYVSFSSSISSIASTVVAVAVAWVVSSVWADSLHTSPEVAVKKELEV